MLFSYFFRFFVILLLFISPSTLSWASQKPSGDYQEYISFFEKVYKVFEDNYYLKPSRRVFDNFVRKFNTKIYAQLKSEKKSNDYVRWRSSWFLVDALKSKDDRFSQFYPPKPAEKFKKNAFERAC